MLICLTYRCKEASHQAEQNNKTGKRQAKQTPFQQGKHPSANKDPAAKNKAKQRKLQATAFPPKLKQRKLISSETSSKQIKGNPIDLGLNGFGPDGFRTRLIWDSELSGK